MSEASYFSSEEEKNTNKQQQCFKEAVCIDAMRVYDSCGEK